MPVSYRTTLNNSRGWVVEIIRGNDERCSSWLLLPAENLWSDALRGFLYILCLLYLFLGIAIASDVFMSSIEVITSKKRKIVRWDEEKQVRVEKEILVWNETVANLTLMALGSSAPEILLAVGETVQNLDQDVDSDGLGTFTIIGSAAFNLLVITAICVMSVPHPEHKKIKELGVFGMTAVWSIFAYIWMLVVLAWVSPGVIEPWEAFVTLAYFPAMVLMAYCQDCGWWLDKCCKKTSQVDTLHSSLNVRIVSSHHHGVLTHTGPSKELAMLEREKTMKHSRTNLKDADGSKTNLGSRPGSSHSRIVKVTNYDEKERFTRNRQTGDEETQLIHLGPDNTASQTFARARFRHAAVRSMMGGHKKKALPPPTKPKFSDVVTALTTASGTAVNPEELVGKFTFAAPSYSVLESSGVIEIDVLFHRRAPGKAAPKKQMNGTANGTAKHSETSFNEKDEHTGVVTIEYETREGSAKFDHDFKYTQGSLTFKETEYCKTLKVPIINDDQYEADKDFYVFLKNPSATSSVGDPSVTRVTIIDDDQPGEFQFEEPHYYADLKTGTVTVKVVREHGCDGNVTIEYGTIDGTAKGGEKLGDAIEYLKSEGKLDFKHGETSKTIKFDCVKNAKGSKNFIVTLRNPSLGVKIGSHSATVANITSDDIADRIAELIDDEEEETWADQFKSAMVLECETDEQGREVPIKWYEYLLHFFSFLWKVIFACVPPTSKLGAFPTFVISLLMVGALTVCVEQIGSLLGCVVGLKAAVSGITIIALGTSLPDTFASRTAALHDEYADAAIGNVTGSNSVNVFLGLGLPWVIKSLYLLSQQKTYQVETGNLVSAVILFSIVGTICLFTIVLRRRFLGGELGGSNKLVKYSCGIFMLMLWFIYIVIMSVQVYRPNALPW